ncbi:phosphate/phosphite/phosphonate ABC transporter substrate-binding protein [Pantoea sp. 18069]|uniref:phosphate/phosphite/phosphonate ABC transporter substrate-binding protein n=1 Tax=Pantoea sp. 18069 TaxID=2681415 RepID=UPI001359EF50|nr:phosphate/phosphite/phosphonate ABC transporter substrate-binding protein [Pantoea sp. 18069]
MNPCADTRHPRRRALTQLLGLCGVAAGMHPSRAAEAGEPCELPHRLRLAFIPKNRDEAQVGGYRQLAQALAQVLGMPVDVVPGASYSAVVQGLQAGRIDVAELGPATYVQMQRSGAAARPVAAMVKQPGVLTRYHALLIVRSTSRFRRWQDLRGATLNLVDPASTSGALLPRQAMQTQAGMQLEDYFSRVAYAGSHSRAIAAVHDGLVDAAFVSSDSLALAQQRRAVAAGALRTLWKSPPLPTDPLVVRRKLCPALQERLRLAFLGQQPLLMPALQLLGKQGLVAVDESDYAQVAGMLGLSAP